MSFRRRSEFSHWSCFRMDSSLDALRHSAVFYRAFLSARAHPPLRASVLVQRLVKNTCASSFSSAPPFSFSGSGFPATPHTTPHEFTPQTARQMPGLAPAPPPSVSQPDSTVLQSCATPMLHTGRLRQRTNRRCLSLFGPTNLLHPGSFPAQN